MNQANPSEKPQLARTLKSRHITMISIGGIIGAGLFVGSSAAIEAVGPAVIVSYGLAGLLVLLIMRMLGEMAVAHPQVGSFTEFPRLAIGNWAGFTAGWLYWYFWVVVVAIEAIAGANIIALWIPVPAWQIGLVLLAVLTGSNLLSTRSFGEFEFWFSSIKVAAIIAFIVVAVAFAFGLIGDAGPTWNNLVSHGGFAPKGWWAVIAGATSVIFALVGAEIVTVAAAESENSGAVVGKLTTTLVARIIIFYVGSIALIVAVMPWTSIESGNSPFTAALETMGIPGATTVMNVVVLVAVLSCLNSGIYVASRVLFTLSAHSDAPQWLVRVDKRGVPSRAIIACTLFGFVGVAASAVSPGVVFAFLVNASGAIILFVYLLAVFSHLRLRRRAEAEGRELTLKLEFFPFTSYLAALAILGVLAAMAFTPDLASQLYASLGCLAVVVLAFFVSNRHKQASREAASPRATEDLQAK